MFDTESKVKVCVCKMSEAAVEYGVDRIFEIEVRIRFKVNIIPNVGLESTTDRF